MEDLLPEGGTCCWRPRRRKAQSRPTRRRRLRAAWNAVRRSPGARCSSARDEEGVPRVDGGEPLQVAVPPVVHVYVVRRDAEAVPRGVDVGHFPVTHDDEVGDVPGQIQLRVQLDGALGGLVIRPRVNCRGTCRSLCYRSRTEGCGI